MIAFVSERDGDYEINFMTLPSSRSQGREILQVTNNEADDMVPEWSPDGEWQQFVSGNPTDIYIMSFSDGKTYRLTSDSYSNWAPVWRPLSVNFHPILHELSSDTSIKSLRLIVFDLN